MIERYVKIKKGTSVGLGWDIIKPNIREAFWLKNLTIKEIGYVSACGNIMVDLNAAVNIAIDCKIECTHLLYNLLCSYFPSAMRYVDSIDYIKECNDYSITFKDEAKEYMDINMFNGDTIYTYSIRNDFDTLNNINEKIKAGK